MRRNVIYLSGPMTGIEDYNFPAFHRAAKVLRGDGNVVISPAESVGGDTDMSREWFLKHDIGLLMTSVDVVVVLPGWETSAGALLEVHVAQAIGIPVRRFGRPREELSLFELKLDAAGFTIYDTAYHA